MTAWRDFLSSRGASFDDATVTGFGDPVGELAAARDAAIVCDLTPLASLSVSGSDAAAFLQGQLTNDVDALAVGDSQPTAWCSPKGRVLANFLLRRVAEDGFELLLPPALAEPIRKRLAMFVLRSRVTIADVSAATVRLGVGGPSAAVQLATAVDVKAALHRSTAIDGGTLVALPGERFIAFVAPERAPAFLAQLPAARPAGFPCWQWLTVRAGVPVITAPTQDLFIPQTLNLDALGAVSFRKGCYTGQEIVARMQYRGRLKERLALAHVDTNAPSAGSRVFEATFGDQPCGTVVNAAAAPGGGADLLAVVQTGAVAGGGLRVGATDGAAASLRALPYALPAVGEARGRIA